MVKKGPSKEVDESLDTSKESLVSNGEEYPSPKKTNVSPGGNVESLGDTPKHPVKDDGKAGSSPEKKLQTHVSFSRSEQRDPSGTQAAPNLNPPLLPRRKTRQQLQKEKAAATTIQSAWRGCQVRREIDKMTKAATKIQATFRGHKIRKELPLSLCNHGRSQSKRKKHARKESGSVPEFLTCSQPLGLIGTHTKSQGILPYSNRSRACLSVLGEYSLLTPDTTFLETVMGHRPSKEMFTCSSLNVFAAEINLQRYHNAAIIIQAAWRGYRVRKIIRMFIEAGESQSKSFHFNYICEEILRKDAISGQLFRFRARRHDTVLLGFVPRIRNINVYTVVKGVPASQRPNISVRILSPNAVIQGYQREMSMGAQGRYTVKSPGALRPSQVFVHVDVRKELKKLSALMVKKKQKPGGVQSKGAAVQ